MQVIKQWKYWALDFFIMFGLLIVIVILIFEEKIGFDI